MADLGKAEIIERIRNSLSSQEFEGFVALLWELQGWTTEVTDERKDEGRDVIADRRVPFDETLKIEVKRYSDDSTVNSSDVRKYAVLPGDYVDLAVVVTSGSFTEPAKREAERHNVKLVTRYKLVALIQGLNASG